MHLEKATHRSSEAGLAGWIASNDATLFTMVLVVVIAIFLHAKLLKGARESLQLSGDKKTLAEELASTASELDAVGELLEETSEKLQLTQEQRDQLQQQLVGKLDKITQLNARLDALLAEKGELESQRASLAMEQSMLSSANETLRGRLDAISSQLEQKVAALEQAERERDRLKKQADELDGIVVALKKRLGELNIDLAETQEQAAAALSASENKVKELVTQVAAGDKQAEEYLAQLKRAAELFQHLKAENLQLHEALTEAEQKRQLELLEEGRNNRALVGLKGPLERVAIVFDASGSMRQALGPGQGDRWAEAQAIAATWLSHLNVHECVLIVFSTDVRTFPAGGSFVDLRGEGGKAGRQSLLEHLRGVTPGGATNTFDAMQKAYEYDVDTILLFSDGAPSKATTGLFDAAIAEQIYALCGQHPNIPVNTIGLGNYFDEDLSTFLRTVARITGGTFRGQ
jgi:uncharacterized coiled-coil DUF342 family protein